MAQRNSESGRGAGTGGPRKTGGNVTRGQAKTPAGKKPAGDDPEVRRSRRQVQQKEPVMSQNENKKAESDSSLKDEIAVICVLLFSVLLVLSYFGICGPFGTIVNTVVFGLFGVFGYIFPFLLFAVTLIAIANKHNRSIIMKVLFFVGLIICMTSITEMIFGYNESLGFFEHFSHSRLDYVGNAPAYGGLLGGILCCILCPFVGKAAAVIIMIVLAVIFFLLIAGRAIFTPLTKKGIEHHREHREQERLRREEMGESYGDGFRSRRERRAREADMSIEEAEKIVREAHEKTEKKKGFIDMLLEEGREPSQGITQAGASSCDQSDDSYSESGEIEFSAGQAEEDIVTRELRLKFAGRDTEDPSKIGGTRLQRGQILGRRGVSRHCMVDDGFETGSGRLPESREEDYTPSDFEEVGETGTFLYSGGTAGISDAKNVSGAKNDSEPDEFEGLFDDDDTEPAGGTVLKFPGDGATDNNGSGDLADDITEISSINDEKADELNFSDMHDETSAETADIDGKGTEVDDSSAAQSTDSSGSGSSDGANGGSIEVKAEPKVVPYVFPPISLLTKNKAASKSGDRKELQETVQKLESTFKSFGVGVTVTDATCGPTVTRYELLPDQGVKVKTITALSDDVKLALAAAEIRIEAPIPGKAAVGIEVPNAVTSPVFLRDLIDSPEFKEASSPLTFAVGKDISGRTICFDIAGMPHLLVAGATGSGKSVCINSLIMSVIYKAKPSEVRMIMIDPKRVELIGYNGIPHLLWPVVTDVKKANGVLDWAIHEMDDRYQRFADSGVNNLASYNRVIEEKYYEDGNEGECPDRLPQILIIVDELNDLMMTANSKEVEASICRLTQLARACGIHVVLATQRPSVNVITGTIKANIPSRIAFSVSSLVDSRTIIDQAGAEKLLGKGDMLFYPQGYPKPVRLQGAYVSDREVAEVVTFVKSKSKEIRYSEALGKHIENAGNNQAENTSGEASGPEDDRDELYAECGRFIIENNKASIGNLQRRFKIGFNRAARIMDDLASDEVVGPDEGTKPRKILMNLTQFNAFLGKGSGETGESEQGSGSDPETNDSF